MPLEGAREARGMFVADSIIAVFKAHICMERKATVRGSELASSQRRQCLGREDVMRKVACKLKPPTFEEGFSKIPVVGVKALRISPKLPRRAAVEAPPALSIAGLPRYAQTHDHSAQG